MCGTAMQLQKIDERIMFDSRDVEDCATFERTTADKAARVAPLSNLTKGSFSWVRVSLAQLGSSMGRAP